jgi:DNA helicase-2/ATP-dependent DNA helicase PcrA
LAFELAMRAMGIPFQLVNSLEFFQRREIKDILAYLQLLNNPMDEVAFTRVINTPARGIGKTTVGKLSDFALNNGISMIDASRRVKQIKSISSRTSGQLTKFVALFDRLTKLIDRPLEELLGHLLNESGYREQYGSGDEEDQERLANIEQLLSVARDFDERHGDGSHQLEAFLEETCLVNDTDDWQIEGDRVTLMTLHSSKGLEFPVVYLVAVEEGLLPHERSKDTPDKLEEERRLMFVGITRAQQELQISLAQYRDFRGRRMMTIPSSFLMELPREEMELMNFGSGKSHASVSTYAEDDLSTLDQADEEYNEPVARRIESVEKIKQCFSMQLTTAAELADGGASLPPVSPDDFAQGALVRHPQYGLGHIVALSGSGPERQATVDFPPPTGQMKFVLADSPLRPVTQGIEDRA